MHYTYNINIIFILRFTSTKAMSGKLRHVVNVPMKITEPKNKKRQIIS